MTVRIRSLVVAVCEHSHPKFSAHHTHVWNLKMRECLKLRDGTWVYEISGEERGHPSDTVREVNRELREGLKTAEALARFHAARGTDHRTQEETTGYPKPLRIEGGNNSVHEFETERNDVITDYVHPHGTYCDRKHKPDEMCNEYASIMFHQFGCDRTHPLTAQCNFHLLQD